MILGLLVGLIVAAQIPYSPLAFLPLIAYLALGSRWNHALWESRWKNRADRGTTPETAAFWTTLLLLFVGVAAAAQGDEVIPWVVFALQVAVTAVIIPVTLRRYPGVVAT